jgi:hypothetical protein
MPAFLVTWNLKAEGPARYAVARSKLLKKLNDFNHAYDGSDLDTIAIIDESDINAKIIRDHLRSAMDSNDSIMVLEIGPDYSCYMGHTLRKALEGWSA